MARNKKAPDYLTGFVASAMQVATSQSKIRRAFQREAWQTEAWRYFDEIGEFRYAQTWLAMSVAKADLVVEHKGAEGWEAAPDSAGQSFVDELLDGCGGPSSFLYRTAIQLGVPGESFIVGSDITDTANTVIGYNWRIVDATEIDVSMMPAKVVSLETGDMETVGPESLIIRVWRPHPREAIRADSPAHAVIPNLREIQNISKHIGATVDSRLAGSGLLALPREVSMTTADGVTVDGSAAGDTFMQTLTNTMITPISDRDSPAAVVPIVLRMPGEFIKDVRHITLGTSFDEQALPLRKEAIRRLALGMEMPPEQLLGMGDSNHWSAWLIDEAGVKTSVEPVLQLITDGLTQRFLRPMLEAAKTADVEDWRLSYSVDKLVQRPNRSADAVNLSDRFAISLPALRKASGFDEADAPDEEELRLMLALSLIKQGKSADLSGLTPVGDSGTVADRPIPQLPSTPADTGETQPTANAALVASAETLIMRALERAGNRIRGHQRPPDGVDPCAIHTVMTATGDGGELLEGAFSLAPAVAYMHQIHPATFTAVIARFTLELIRRRRPYDAACRAELAAQLQAAPLQAVS